MQFPVLIKTAEGGIQKYFSLSAIKQNLIHFKKSATLGAMNFQMWELFLAHSNINTLTVSSPGNIDIKTIWHRHCPLSVAITSNHS